MRDDVGEADQEIVRPEHESHEHIPAGIRPDQDVDLDEDEISGLLLLARDEIELEKPVESGKGWRVV